MAKPDSTAYQLTVLTTRGISAVKTYRLEGEEIVVDGYGRAKHFTARVINVDPRGLWLEKRRSEHESFVILGSPVNWKRGEKRRRLSSPRDGAEATIIDVPRALMPIDVDQIDFTPTLDGFDEGESFALDVMDRLRLRGVRCVWHLTNSHGFFGKRRIRLWAELETPATAAEMKAFAKDRWGDDKVDVDGKIKPIVDLAVYQCQQPIYTGDPILLDGIEDPVTRRVGFIDGEPLELKVAKSKRKTQGAPEDENIAKLEAAGLYIKRLKPGQHCIVCPWEEVHSGEERDDDTFYFEPHHNGHDIPAYKCHHASCEEKKWADVLDYIGETVPPEIEADEDEEKGPSWVFVYRLKSFWDARDGALIDKESYDATHGGKSKKGTPTDRFLASKRSEKADIAEFLPGAERFVMRGRIRVLNTYTDLRVKPDSSIDVTPWVEHLEWLVPSREDRERLMDWLAWAYQKPGQKITWGPILYSETHGVGKTTVFNCLARCIGPAQVSEPTQAELEDKFNDWAFGKLLVKIEELRSGDRYHVAEKLKPVVANPTLSIRQMHKTGFVVTNVANVCASTNHMNALPVERSDRRYMLIQCREERDGEDERKRHMRALHAWLEQVGYGGIAHWLATRDVSEFVPTSEAPMTELKRAVARSSMTDFERAIELCDAFDDEDFVSSAMIEGHLRSNGINVEKIANQLGNIAYKRGWKSPSKVATGLADRVRIGGQRVTFWLPGGKPLAFQKLMAKRPEARTQTHERLVAKATYGEVSSDE